MKATAKVQLLPIGRALVEQVSSAVTNSAPDIETVRGPEFPVEQRRPLNLTSIATKSPVVLMATEPNSGEKERKLK
jgi:hypothetical protein